MNDPLKDMILYLRLALACQDRLQMSDRNRALIVAGTCACMLEMKPIADFCRLLILQNNSGHMARRYDTFLDMVKDPDFGVFLKQVRRKLPLEKAESMLAELDYQCDVKRTDYASDLAYAAAVMGVDVKWLKENFG